MAPGVYFAQLFLNLWRVSATPKLKPNYCVLAWLVAVRDSDALDRYTYWCHWHHPSSMREVSQSWYVAAVMLMSVVMAVMRSQIRDEMQDEM